MSTTGRSGWDRCWKPDDAHRCPADLPVVRVRVRRFRSSSVSPTARQSMTNGGSTRTHRGALWKNRVGPDLGSVGHDRARQRVRVDQSVRGGPRRSPVAGIRTALPDRATPARAERRRDRCARRRQERENTRRSDGPAEHQQRPGQVDRAILVAGPEISAWISRDKWVERPARLGGAAAGGCPRDGAARSLRPGGWRGDRVLDGRLVRRRRWGHRVGGVL